MHDIALFKEKIISLKDKVRGLNILVVDDEELIRVKTGAFMEKFFDKVDCAKDGKDALKMFTGDTSYSIIITDLQMPYMTGEELIQELRAIDPDLFIVIMTGTPYSDDKLTQTYDICLEKPVDIDDMVQMLEQLTQKKKL